MSKYKVDITGINTSELRVLTQGEMTSLFIMYQNGSLDAKEKLINGNLKLVLSILKNYNRGNVNMDDLFQVGVIGLIKAIDNFDITYGLKLSTYAVPLIEGEIKRYLRDNTAMRVSRSTKDLAYQIIKFKDEYFIYSMDGSSVKVHSSSDLSNWSLQNATGLATLPNSILPLEKIILATADNKVYESTDGIAWTESNKFSGEVNTFISAIPIENDNSQTEEEKYIQQATYLKTEDNVRYLYSILESELEIGNAETKIQAAGENFPTKNISYTTFKKGGQYQNVIIGEHDESIKITVGDKEIPVSIAWGYNGTTWAELGTTSTVAYCPEFKNPTIIYYNNLLYTFGDKFESIYVSKSEGIAWQKADKKFSFPYQDWSDPEFKPTIEKPEFMGRTNYSVVQDTKNDYIYFLFSKGDVLLEEGENTHPYSHDSEIWRARLNQLWFDKDPKHAGQ